MNRPQEPINTPLIPFQYSYDRVYSEIYETSYDTRFVFSDGEDDEEEMLNASKH